VHTEWRMSRLKKANGQTTQAFQIPCMGVFCLARRMRLPTQVKHPSFTTTLALPLLLTHRDATVPTPAPRTQDLGRQALYKSPRLLHTTFGRAFPALELRPSSRVHTPNPHTRTQPCPSTSGSDLHQGVSPPATGPHGKACRGSKSISCLGCTWATAP